MINEVQKHNLSAQAIGMLWSLLNEDWTRDNFKEFTERYDLDGVKGFVELKEKGLIHYEPTKLEVWPLIMSGSGKMSQWEVVFNVFRTKYPQRQGKRGNSVEYDNFKKACKKHGLKWQEEIMKLSDALDAEIRHRKNLASRGRNEADWSWPMLSTYINQARWTAEYVVQEVASGSEMYNKYLDWVKKTFDSDSVESALSESQYNDFRALTGSLSIFKGKVSEHKVKTKMAEGHKLFFAKQGKDTIFETIVDLLKRG